MAHAEIANKMESFQFHNPIACNSVFDLILCCRLRVYHRCAVHGLVSTVFIRKNQFTKSKRLNRGSFCLTLFFEPRLSLIFPNCRRGKPRNKRNALSELPDIARSVQLR